MKPRSHPDRIATRGGAFRGIVLMASVAAIAAGALAQQATPPATAPPPSSDVEACKANLNLIFEAIQEYQKVNHTWPDFLSDLHPDFLLDLNCLICPAVLRSGGMGPEKRGLRTDPFEDPVPTTYSYEFKTKKYPLWADRASTDRDFKLRQMKVVGSNVPIVRCMQHTPGLFLSVGGTIFESSGTDWESVFKDVVDIEELYPHRIFRDLAPLPGRFTDGISPRAPATDPNLIDLSAYYTSAMHRPWLWRNRAGGDLSELPQGVVALPGMPLSFDIRGVIQLTARNMISPFPTRVDGIAVRQKGRFLHFLEGAVLGEKTPSPQDRPGTGIGRYELRYADGQRLPIPIRYAIDVLEWNHAGNDPALPDARVAWEGTNRVSGARNRLLRLYHQRWENPRPDVAIESFDFVSGMAGAAPFLIGVTLEP